MNEQPPGNENTQSSASASTSGPGFAKHPNYEVKISDSSSRLRVLVGDTVVADTTRALAVEESRHHPVWYLPMEDLDGSLLQPTETSTYCPFKGHASYWSINIDGETIPDAVWSYPDPYLECLRLTGYVSFYTDQVQLEIDGERQAQVAPGWSDR